MLLVCTKNSDFYLEPLLFQWLATFVYEFLISSRGLNPFGVVGFCIQVVILCVCVCFGANSFMLARDK